MAVVLTDLGVRVEHPIAVDVLGAFGSLRGAWPLDPAPAAQERVAHPGVVAGAARVARLPGFECRLGVMPGNQWGTVFVGERHPSREVEENIEIGPGLTRWLDRFVRKMDRAVDIREGADLLAPDRGRQHDVSEPG